MSELERNQQAIDILSKVTVHMKYSRYIDTLQRRETWRELVTRNKNMHIKRYPHLKQEIDSAYSYVYERKVLPSMRSLQFGGKPIEMCPNRLFNCCYLPIDSIEAFSEVMFLLLGGTGVGYSVQLHHICKLGPIRRPYKRSRRFLVGDSIEGWADAVKMLVKSYYKGGYRPNFDFSDVRSKGARLITAGGKAPGPKPLRECLVKIQGVLDETEVGERLTSLQIHDILCFIADAVLSGGIRRSAMIALFSATDMQMLSCKTGSWWETNAQRGRANNSVVLLRDKCTFSFFADLWKRVEYSRCGEPGIYWTNDPNLGTNPCVETCLKGHQFCNLTEIDFSSVQSQVDFNGRCKAASFIGTLQASYTDFHYLRPCWRESTEKDALLGVSMTGIANTALLSAIDLHQGVDVVRSENERVAKIINIRPAARLTCVKPAGTTSLVVGASSGIHAWHSATYIRRLRVQKNESIYTYLKENVPRLLEDEFFSPHTTAVISVPQHAPTGAILRDSETCIDLLERVKHIFTNWIQPGHVRGRNTHNVSCTLSIKDNEWDAVGAWMFKHKQFYNGMACLPYDRGTYKQTPFEECKQDVYSGLLQHLEKIDLSKVTEVDDNTLSRQSIACAGGKCEL